MHATPRCAPCTRQRRTFDSRARSLILPLFAFANAAVVAFNGSYLGALGSMLATALVLDVDECTLTPTLTQTPRA